MAYATHSRTGGSSIAQRIAEARAALADRYAKYQVYRATYNELATLNDRDLADLGISRSMIRTLATEAAYGN